MVDREYHKIDKQLSLDENVLDNSRVPSVRYFRQISDYIYCKNILSNATIDLKYLKTSKLAPFSNNYV